jgi:hypothetical protein
MFGVTFGALAWSALIFAAVLGWGRAVLRLLHIRTADVSVSCVAGLGALSFAGGILNLLHLIHPGLLEAILLVGAGLSLPALTQAWKARAEIVGRQPSAMLIVTVVLFCAVFALRYASSVHRTEYQGVDDYEAYLFFSAKMKALHFFAPDPFNERRLQSSIGLAYFLQQLFLARLPLACTQMADQALGVALLAAAAFGLARVAGLSRPRIWLFALACVAMPHIRFNLTMTTLPSALLLAAAAIAVTQAWESRTGAQAVLLGTSAALVIGCKSTYLPHVFFFGAVFYALAARRRGIPRSLRDLGIAAATAILLLLPWMVAMRMTEGTFFFPLGHGFDYTAYYHFPPASTFHTHGELLKVLVFALLLVPFVWLAMLVRRKDSFADAAVAMTAAALLGSLVTGYVAGGDSLRRYNYPCVLPALLLVLLLGLRLTPERRESHRMRLARWLMPAAVGLLLVWFVYMLRWENVYREMAQDLAASAHPWRIAPPDAEQEYVALNAALPREGIVLETLDYPFLLDFTRHRIFSADFPASASLPPGWPIHGNGESLARYLQGHGIRYLAYAYGDSAFLVDAEASAGQTNPSVTQAWRNILFLLLRGHQQYAQLAQTRQHIYDDGKIYVLDLEARQ